MAPYATNDNNLFHLYVVPLQQLSRAHVDKSLRSVHYDFSISVFFPNTFHYTHTHTQSWLSRTRHRSGTQKFYWFGCVASGKSASIVRLVCTQHSQCAACAYSNMNYLLFSVWTRFDSARFANIFVWDWKSAIHSARLSLSFRSVSESGVCRTSTLVNFNFSCLLASRGYSFNHNRSAHRPHSPLYADRRPTFYFFLVFFASLTSHNGNGTAWRCANLLQLTFSRELLTA